MPPCCQDTDHVTGRGEALLGALEHLTFTEDELTEIDRYAVDGGLNIWEPTTG